LRKTLRLIADEETGHAEFSLALHEWCISRLSNEEAAEVNAARRQAAEQLSENLPGQFAAEPDRAAGLPSLAEATVLYNQLQPVLAA
ncbi:MAG: hypothetical protein MK135_07995, partial [Polyangiaceae bacterium]|nr:hypothetical protein [Polyangiaceae bacterium]